MVYKSSTNSGSSGSGTVTSASVVTANGFAGTVANPTTAPAITLTTSISGLLKGNGTAMSAATAGTDYSAGTNALATGIVKSTTGTGALTIAVAGDFPTLNQNTTGTAAGLSATLAVTSGGTNATSYLAPSGTLCPLFFWNGTQFSTNSVVTHLGYDTATDTVYTGAINISSATTQTAKFTNTAASGASGGAGMQGYSDDGAALASGDRLGFYALGGAKDAAHTTANASIIEGFATENWGAGATGSKLVLSTTANTTTNRLTALTLDHDQSATFAGVISASNLSGTNTGDVTLAAIGSTANANGASLTGQALTLQPASASFGGVITTGTQTIAGAKTFSSGVDITAGQSYKYGGTAFITALPAANNYFFCNSGNLTGSGMHNYSFGTGSLAAYTSGGQNVAIGTQTLKDNTTGDYNVGIGHQALLLNIGGTQNFALGALALGACTSGSYNIAIGVNALKSITTTSNNVGIGASALLNATGGSNTVIGTTAGQGALSGSTNTMMGFQTGYGMTTGSANTIIGNSASAASLNQITTGSNNISIGNDVAVASATASNQLCIANYFYGTAMDGTGSTISSGNLGLGVKAPTARLHLPAGTASANTAPLKLTSGTVNTTPEAGAIEFDGNNFFVSPSSTRYKIPMAQIYVIGGDVGSLGNAQVISTTNARLFIPFKFRYATKPTGITVANAGNFTVDDVNGNNVAVTAVTFINSTVDGILIDFQVAAGLTKGAAIVGANNANATITLTGGTA